MVTRSRARQATGNAAKLPSQTDGRVATARVVPDSRMSRVDTAWLRMDSPHNLMMIVGVWVLRPGIAYVDLAQRLQERMTCYHRFVQCAVPDATGVGWVADPAFDMANHLVRETLQVNRKVSQKQALQNRLAELCMQPLDRRHPLWQFHLVEHYQGGSALMVRIHHCIADGMALLAVTQSLMDGVAPPPARPESAEGADNNGDWFARALLQPVTRFTVKALNTLGDSAAKSLQLLHDAPVDKLASGTADLARTAIQVTSDLAALALMPDDSPTSLKGRPGRHKCVAWCAPLPLAEVKAVGKALNCSINDVLLSCVAGAMGAYLHRQGECVSGKEIRAMVPVNLRPPGQACQLGNQFGLVPLVLPLGLGNPVERLFEVRRRMAGLKGSLQPLLTFGLLAVAGMLVKPAQDALLGLFSKKTTAVMTNVPGPVAKQKLCGAAIEETLFWVPQSGSVGLGVSILSYGGGVQFGIVSDATLCPDPQQIIDQFEPEFAKLSLLALMLPWGEG